MTHHFCQASLDPREFGRFCAARGFAKGDPDEGAALHALLSGVFGKGAFQPFRLFTPRGEAPRLYGVAQADAAALAGTARAVAEPDMLAVLPPASIRSKPVPQGFAPDTRLGFDLATLPTVRLRATGAEKDAFLASFPEGEAPGEARDAVYGEWLSRRLFPAAEIEAVRLARFDIRHVRRGGTRRAFPHVVFHGTLVVRDAPAFDAVLRDGVGRHKAYGAGLLILRPPDTEPTER